MGESFIIMAGTAGALGALRLYEEMKGELEERFPASFLRRKAALEEEERLLSMLNPDIETGTIIDFGEKGVFKTLWKLGQMLGTGFEVELDRIPLDQLATEIYELKETSIYDAPAGKGCLIVTDEPFRIIERGRENGIRCAVIGRLNNTKACVVKANGITRFLTPE